MSTTKIYFSHPWAIRYKITEPASTENIITQYHVVGSGEMREDPYSHLTEEQKKKDHKHSIRSFISILIHS